MSLFTLASCRRSQMVAYTTKVKHIQLETTHIFLLLFYRILPTKKLKLLRISKLAFKLRNKRVQQLSTLSSCPSQLSRSRRACTPWLWQGREAYSSGSRLHKGWNREGKTQTDWRLSCYCYYFPRRTRYISRSRKDQRLALASHHLPASAFSPSSCISPVRGGWAWK